MSKYHIERLSPLWKKQWDDFVDNSNNGTIFHKLKFLEYHGNKFKNNEYHIVFLKGESLFAVMPMAIFEEDGKKIARSPYGASYGGIITKNNISLEVSDGILSLFIDFLKESNINECQITLPPTIYTTNYSDYIKFAMMKNGFYIKEASLSAVIKTSENPKNNFQSSAKNKILKADKENIFIKESQDYDVFYRILLENRKKYNVKPTHSLEEMKKLNTLLPNSFKLFMAYKNNKAIAGTWVVITNGNVILDFYWAHLVEYQKYSPINKILESVTKLAFEHKFKFFDLGTMTFGLNYSLGHVKFKESFNAVGLLRETYLWKDYE